MSGFVGNYLLKTHITSTTNIQNGLCDTAVLNVTPTDDLGLN